MEKENTRKYTNGEITILWQPDSCIHSAVCWRGATGMPEVFNPKQRPWINMQAAGTAAIIEQVKKCPSGALSFTYNDIQEPVKPPTPFTQVELLPDGPLLVHGDLNIKHPDGSETNRQSVTAFCRCGHSNKKPFCDGSHKANGFKG